MTSRGELYINEDCAWVFSSELNRDFGTDKWQLDGSKFSHINDMSQFPNIVDVDVADRDTQIIIGSARITSKPVIQKNNNERWIEVVPQGIHITVN